MTSRKKSGKKFALRLPQLEYTRFPRAANEPPCPRQSRHCESGLLEQMSTLYCYKVKASACSGNQQFCLLFKYLHWKELLGCSTREAILLKARRMPSILKKRFCKINDTTINDLVGYTWFVALCYFVHFLFFLLCFRFFIIKMVQHLNFFI